MRLNKGASERHRELEPARTRAARIEKKNAIALLINQKNEEAALFS